MQFDGYTHPDRFGQLLGYQVVSYDGAAGEARVSLTVREDHLSPAAKVHGGVIASVLDYACGLAVLATLAQGDRCSTVEIKINYFRPVELGEELEAVAKVAFRGKKLCALIATLHRRGDQEQVAMASATFNVVRAAGKSEKNEKR